MPVFAASIALGGCWTAPVASVQPKGEPRLIQEAVAVRSVRNPAIVQSVDARTRTVVVLNPGNLARSVYKAGPRVANFDQIRVGDKVQATVAAELTILVSQNGRVPAGLDKLMRIGASAKVLTVDPSYRLLTLQYPDGSTEMFKVGLEVRLQEMEPGDDVVVRDLEAVALRVRAQ